MGPGLCRGDEAFENESVAQKGFSPGPSDFVIRKAEMNVGKTLRPPGKMDFE